MNTDFFKRYSKRTIIERSLLLLLGFSAILYCLIFTIPEETIAFLILLAFLFIDYEIENSHIQELVCVISTTVFTSYFSQAIIVVGTDISKIKKSTLWVMSYLAGNDSILLNIIIIALVYLILKFFGLGSRLAMMITPFPFLLLTLADYYVVSYRSTELIGPDIFSVFTALDVAMGHAFDLILPTVYLLIPLVIYEYIVYKSAVFKNANKKRERLLNRFLKLIICVEVFLFIFSLYTDVHIVKTYGVFPSLTNTFINNFLLSLFLMMPSKPNDYSIEYINDYANEYVYSDISNQVYDDDVNIIVIMNEAFADVNLYNGKISIDEDNMPYFHQLTLEENTVSGYYLASIFGGNTANSEFEFLTGMSMADLPDGTVPFSLYIRDNIMTLPSYLKTLGYVNIGMHPARASNYKRDTVYDYLGFDKKYFIDDFNMDGNSYIRTLCSDANAYSNMLKSIDEEHQSGNKRVFAMLVTIQNHSSFEDCYDFDNLSPNTYVSASSSGVNIKELNGYMSLINESDKALSDLISELRSRDEKYVVFFFGDHQPSVTGWKTMATYDQQVYEVPFFLWANYDIDENIKDDIETSYIYNDSFVANTSMNYCAIDVLKYAGIPLSPVFFALDDIRNEVPIISANWIYDINSNSLQPVSISYRETLSKYKLYSYIEYDLLFDKENSILMN